MSRPELPERPIAAALDLGSTSIKAALVDGSGRLAPVLSAPAPPLRARGDEREGDALAYAQVTEDLLDRLLRNVPRGTPLGISTQRSTFLVWDRRDATPRTPMVSWQDGRGASWCALHRTYESEAHRRTGLILSGHYLGPKLAAMQERDPELRARLRSGSAVVGTLESWILARWAGAPRTDPTVAARTLLYDLEAGDWSDELLRWFDVPRAALVTIGPTSGTALRLRSVAATVTATVADQAAAVQAALPSGAAGALVNLGTGAFVMASATDAGERRPGLLTGLIDSPPEGPRRFVLEGPVNGAAPALAACGPGPTALAVRDPTPGAFCVPDVPAAGAPWWRADLADRWSDAGRALAGPERRRVVLEGLLFRVREILERMGPSGPVRLAGGLGRDPFVAAGLAALLGRPIERLVLGEASLLGAARLAAGLPSDEPPVERIDPAEPGAYLREKYERWRAWLASVA